MKVVIAGPPRSGKSCLREGLKQAIRGVLGAPYPYVITACPDGEGAWFQETVNADPELAAACKAAYKGKFTPEFVRRVAESVRNCPLPLVLVDIGGVASPENEAICAGATHMILISSNPAQMPEWRAFAARVGLTVVAELVSDYHGTMDTWSIENGVMHGRVHHLERGEPVKDRPTIRRLAELLNELASDTERVVAP